ncbi:MAG: hypothetical protein CM15mP115_24220 [Alphaproteobacteria bacterium]|nr:MAG: hypothetical protein CM15mP115_24220 [Alphaproteobacteria bacterium]
MAHAGADSALGMYADTLSRYRRLADESSVFGFYSSVLIETRQEFRRRLGPAVDETLDHFLGLAQAFGTAGGVSLTAFLAQVRGSGGEVRRDMDGGSGNELRVMTIHGAKGLEAPVVVLPDMLKPRSARPDQLVRDPETGFVYWAPGTLRPDFVTAARDAAKTRREEEENRLLYVALTRARDGIVIGGWQSKSSRTLEGSHYEGLAAAINGMEGAATDDEGIVRIDEVAGDVPESIDDMIAPPPVTEGWPRPGLCRNGCSPARRTSRDRHGHCVHRSLTAGRPAHVRPGSGSAGPRRRWRVAGLPTSCSRCCLRLPKRTVHMWKNLYWHRTRTFRRRKRRHWRQKSVR